MPEGEKGWDATGIEERLRQPLVPREEGVFRLGLALGGTTATAAWTAGALDFLVEALDLWDDRKGDDRARGDGRASVPDHALRLGIAGGASGGGLCAALLARAAGWDFPHATDAEAVANDGNPFWRAFVEGSGGVSPLDAVDLGPSGSAASAMVAAAAGVIRDWPDVALPPRRRAWLGDPFRVALAFANLRGVPYRTDSGPDGGGRVRSGHHLEHADHARFAVPADAGDAAALGLRGDEHLIHDAAGWARFADLAAAATGVPDAAAARRLGRPAADYDWRGVALPGEGGAAPARIAVRLPAWDALDASGPGDAPYTFDGACGGTLGDRPLELVRSALAGLGGSNPRDPKEAHTAVLLLDPLGGVAALPPPGGACGILGALGGPAATWAEGASASTADLLLALEPMVASRFLLAARRERDGRPRHGAAALATAGMGGLLGALSRAFRVHDYMMGRENCRYFLMHEFVLHEDNPLFRGFAARHPMVAEEYRPCPGQPGWLPIVPVAEHLRVPRLLPAWPRGALDPARLGGPMEERFALLLRRWLEGGGVGDPPAGPPVDRIVARSLARALEAEMRVALAAAALD